MARIVMVDDNAVTLKRWEALLAPLGHEILSFSGAEPALQLLSIHPCSLVILDLAMPIHSGYDLMRTLRVQNIDVPVLVVSGKNNQQDIEKAMQLGASDYVIKPFDDDIFLAKVSLLLQDTDSDQKFAEAQYVGASQLLLTIPKLSVSEMGFYFHSAFSVSKGALLQLSSPCFAEMGIKDTQFRASSCEETPADADGKYKIFISFVGLSQNQLRDVRLWIRQNQMKFRRAN